jgi:hypothetical protein
MWQTGGTTRWEFVTDTSGSDNLALYAFGPTGVFLGTVMQISPTVTVSNVNFQVAGNVGFNNTAPIAKRTGWGAPTGTATRTAFATTSVTLPQLAEHVKALIDDLTAYGLIGT